MSTQPNIPANIALVSDAVEYFSDSHNIQSLDNSNTEIQTLDKEVSAQKQSFGPRKLISDALRAELSAGEAEILAKQLITDAKTATRASDRISAIAEVTDRTEGKPVQNVRHAGVFMVLAPGEEVLSAAFGSLPPSEDE